MYIVVITYKKPWDEVMRWAQEHRAYALSHYAEGNYLMSGRKSDKSGGVILANAPDRARLDAILQGDPFWREKVALYEVIEFLPQMAAEPFKDYIIPI